LRSAGDDRAGPGGGVDAEAGQDLLLQLGAVGDGGDVLLPGGEGEQADAVELL
jgi:hypothetical protein